MRAITRLAVSGACVAALFVIPTAAADAAGSSDPGLYAGDDPHGAFDEGASTGAEAELCAFASREERSRGRCSV